MILAVNLRQKARPYRPPNGPSRHLRRNAMTCRFRVKQILASDLPGEFMSSRPTHSEALHGNRQAKPELQSSLSNRQSRSRTRKHFSGNYMPSVRRSISGARRQIRLEVFHAARGHRAYQKAEAPNVARVPDSLSGLTLLGRPPQAIAYPWRPLARHGYCLANFLAFPSRR